MVWLLSVIFGRSARVGRISGDRPERAGPGPGEPPITLLGSETAARALQFDAHRAFASMHGPLWAAWRFSQQHPRESTSVPVGPVAFDILHPFPNTLAAPFPTTMRETAKLIRSRKGKLAFRGGERKIMINLI